MFPTAALFLSLLVASASSSPTNLTRRTTSPVAVGYYTGWHNEDFPLTDVSWEKYTHMIYSFAETVEDPSGALYLNRSSPEVIPDFVKAAHDNNVKAMIAVGGWTGSLHFSTNVENDANRKAFVQSVVSLVQSYGLDGVDFDWEYPGSEVGVGCNAKSADDTANYLLFLQELRADPAGKDFVVSAPTAVRPWLDASGNPSSDISGFADVLDFITIMNYDLWGSWSATAGPNAPLDDSCESADKQQGSAVSSVKAWNDAGMPSDHIVMGVATYGHSFSVNASSAFPNGDGVLAAYPLFDASVRLVGDRWDNATGSDVCGKPFLASGNMDLFGLVEGGWLTEEGVAADGIAYVYGDCDRTPRVYNQEAEHFVAFDDATSVAEKGVLISTMGLRGFAMWEAGGDYNDILLDSVRVSSSLF